MRLSALALLVALIAVPASAEFVPPAGTVVPGEYIVLGCPERASALIVVHAQVVKELPLQNFPGGKVVRTSREVAEAAASRGCTVVPEFLVLLLSDPPEEVVQSPAPWHLDRIDQRTRSFDGTYRYQYAGRNVRAYVLDSGILLNPDLADRLAPGADFVGDGGGVHADCGQEGTHGTGVASMLGGTKYGVAKSVTIVPVRGAGCDGYFRYSAVIASLDWILSDARKHLASRAVVNMSFGGVGRSELYDPYFKKLDAAGILLVDGAGNSTVDACTFTPASSQYTITTGGTRKGDQRYDGSNWGKCVDLFAPGQNVPNMGGLNDQEWAATGTSGSAPQVAGHAAQLLEQFPDASPARVRALLVANATPGVLGNLRKGSPNRLLYTGAFQEAFTRFVPRWSPGERRFTVQIEIDVPGGGPSPAERVSLYRGTVNNGRCQGSPFARLPLTDGAAATTVRGWTRAPAYICAETSLGTVAQAAVQTP